MVREVKVVEVGVYANHVFGKTDDEVYIQDSKGKLIAGTARTKDGVILHYPEFLYSAVNNLKPANGLEIVVVHPGNLMKIQPFVSKTEPISGEVLRNLVDLLIKQGNYEIGFSLDNNLLHLH